MHVRRVLCLCLIALLAGCVSTPAPGEFSYVALGASDAVGIGALPLRRGYVFRIRDALGSRGSDVQLSNLGIPGAQIDDIAAIARLTVAARPDLITLWTGANDLIDGDDPEDFEANLERLLDRLRGDTDAVIVIADLPDLTRIPRFRDRPSRAVTTARVRAFNAAILEQADDFDVPVVRLSELDMLEELTSTLDGFHPNNEGHRMIAERFVEVIEQALDASRR
jgi:lysophospholipase L1-like esterase